MMGGMLTPPAVLEAILFASGEAIEKKQLAKFLEITDQELTVALEVLTDSLKGHGIALIETKDAVELRTAPEANPVLKKLRESELSRDLGKASLETLAVIAYQNGATRAQVDWVRGVNSTASLRTLLLRGLIEAKEDEADKRRLQYSITTEALSHLGLTSTDQLPRAQELRAIAKTTAMEEKDIESV
jgi:segregation and condensation protein B